MASHDVKMPGGAAPSTNGQGQGQPVVVDIGKLANILLQARGPILDRLGRALPKLSGDGSVDVAEWLADLERLCRVERVECVDIIDYMLEGNAARVYRRMMVSEASQWDAVRAALLAEYALPRQEAWRRFTARRLEADEAVDVYVDDLERLGQRLGVASVDLVFRTKFYEGLPAAVYEWAVTRTGAYTAEFNSVVADVRARLSARKAVAGRDQAIVVAAAPGSVSCYRCGGPHRVRACPAGRRQSVSGERRASQKLMRKKGNCFRCGKAGHFARDCPAPAAAGAVAGACGDGPDFIPGDGARCATPPGMDVAVE